MRSDKTAVSPRGVNLRGRGLHRRGVSSWYRIPSRIRTIPCRWQAGTSQAQSLTRARAWFATDPACTAYLDWLRWPDGFICPHCQTMCAGNLAQGVYRCRGCRRRVSVTAGTIFDKTRVPLTVWFEAAWTFATSKAGVSASSFVTCFTLADFE